MQALATQFANMVNRGNVEIYNEFSLQHEFGIFLRKQLADVKVQFERNVKYFFQTKQGFIKKEIDLAVFKDKADPQCAIEFKFPLNGQHPEQLYSFCKDIVFLEQLKKAGFKRAFFIAFVDDRLFYSGQCPSDIYRYFRAGTPLTGEIFKPTGEGKGTKSVAVTGKYNITWNTVMDTIKYTLVEIQ